MPKLKYNPVSPFWEQGEKRRDEETGSLHEASKSKYTIIRFRLNSNIYECVRTRVYNYSVNTEAALPPGPPFVTPLARSSARSVSVSTLIYMVMPKHKRPVSRGAAFEVSGAKRGMTQPIKPQSTVQLKRL